MRQANRDRLDVMQQANRRRAFDAADKRFDGIDRRLDAMDERFDKRFEGIDRRLDNIVGQRRPTKQQGLVDKQ